MTFHPPWWFDRLNGDLRRILRPRLARCFAYDDETAYFTGVDLRRVAEAAYKAGMREGRKGWSE